MKALQYSQLSLRDVDVQVYDSMGIQIIVSTAKGHEERGRVEQKIRTIKDTSEKTGISTTSPMSTLQWETVFQKISSTIDDLPLARGDTSSSSNLGFEILTANRLKLSRNNNRSLEGPEIIVDMNPNLTRILERNREIYSSGSPYLFITSIC